MTTSFIFLAAGFEEIEALATADILRRAGMDVKTVAITPTTTTVTGAHGITVIADTTIDNIDPANARWLILPGGMPGATNLAACQKLSDLLIAQHQRKAGIAAICAAPAVVLAPLGLLRDLKATVYPSFEQQLHDGGATYVNAKVIESGTIITANGPSSADLFALTIVSATLGQDAADTVAAGMLL